MNIKQVLKNISYTISSNLLTLAISALTILIVPKFIGVQAYGYWQLYIFYATYVVMLQLGWLDGIYLRYGGAVYKNLDRGLFFSQFAEFFFAQCIIAVVICLFGFWNSSGNRLFIFLVEALVMIIVNLTQFCMYILQDTNRMRHYAIVNISGRIVYFFIVLMLIYFSIKKFEFYILADIVGRLVSMLYSFYFCRDIIFRKISSFFWTIQEVWLNLSVGIKLLAANVADLLIIGIIRYGIERTWGVSVFGKVSLTLNISNLLMVFINAISLVLYPALRRISNKQLKQVYMGLRDLLMVSMFVGLLLYYPIEIILPAWLPKYKSGLIYIALLFPMCVYSGKFQLLISTFMKTYRLERDLLMVNVISVAASFAVTLLNVILIKNLTLMMCSVVFSLWVQSTVGELILCNKLGLKTINKIILETVFVILFMSFNWFLNFPVNFFLYVVALLGYVLLNINNIKKGINVLLKKNKVI